MNALNQLTELIFQKKRWILHAFFWLAVLGFYVLFFGRRNSNYWQTAFFVGLLLPIAMGATYFLNYYLVPNYLMREKYGRFLTYTVYLVMGALFLEMMVTLLTFLVIAGLRIQNMSPASFDLVLLLSSLLLVTFLALAIKMATHWRQSKAEYDLLLRDKMETELKFLKSQLNPHFLFNTLNNLYYLASEKSDKTPKAILALSEILDYVLHAGKSLLVPLSDEIKQVNNYLALELLRYEERVDVSLQISGNPELYQVPPMVLITLVENAFKHGVMPISGKSWIRIIVHAKEEGLLIFIQNSSQSSELGTGIGLENLRRQLSHLYKNNYQLQIDSSKGTEFSVNLALASI
jgi:sensor histidine kinase YesM